MSFVAFSEGQNGVRTCISGRRRKRNITISIEVFALRWPPKFQSFTGAPSLINLMAWQWDVPQKIQSPFMWRDVMWCTCVVVFLLLDLLIHTLRHSKGNSHKITRSIPLLPTSFFFYECCVSIPRRRQGFGTSCWEEAQGRDSQHRWLHLALLCESDAGKLALEKQGGKTWADTCGLHGQWTVSDAKAPVVQESSDKATNSITVA